MKNKTKILPNRAYEITEIANEAISTLEKRIKDNYATIGLITFKKDETDPEVISALEYLYAENIEAKKELAKYQKILELSRKLY